MHASMEKCACVNAKHSVGAPVLRTSEQYDKMSSISARRESSDDRACCE